MVRTYNDYTEEEVSDLLQHPDVVTAFSHFEESDFQGEPGAIRVFWSSDFDPFSNYNHGLQIAIGYRKSLNRIRANSAYTNKDFEKYGKIKTLDGYSRDPLNQFRAVAAGISYSFARSASHTVAVSVMGSKPESMFRCVELGVLLERSDKENFVLLSKKYPRGQVYNKAEAYHLLRDKWFQNSIHSYRMVKKRIDDQEFMRMLTEDEKETLHNEFRNNARDLAYEIVFAEKSIRKELPGISSSVHENARIALGRVLIEQCEVLNNAVKRERAEVKGTFVEEIIKKYNATQGGLRGPISVDQEKIAREEVLAVVKKHSNNRGDSIAHSVDRPSPPLVVKGREVGTSRVNQANDR